MSNSGAIRAGKAYVELYGDKTRLQKDLQDSKGELATWGASVTALGASAGAGLAAGAGVLAGAFRTAGQAGSSAVSLVATAIDTTQEKLSSWGSSVQHVGASIFGLGAAIKASLSAALATFQEMGSEMQKLSDRTGASVEALSTLGFAAAQSGASADSLHDSIEHMGKALSGVGEGAKDTQQAIGQLGLSLGELSGLSPEERFRMIADRLARIEDPTIRAAGAFKIFGSSAQGILPMLAQGAGHIKALEDRARALGLEMTSKDARSAQDLKLALGELWATVKMVSFAVGAPLADSMREMVKLGTDVVAKVLKWVKENGALIVNVNNLATALMVAGGAVIGIGTALSGFAATIGYITAAVAAILSPVALVTAAVAGLGYAFVTYTEMGQSALRSLLAVFGELKTDGMQAFDAIATALKSGNIEGAMKVLGALLKLEWAKAIQFLTEKWLSFKSVAIGVAADIAVGISNAFFEAIRHIRRSLFELQLIATAAGVALDPTKSKDEKNMNFRVLGAAHNLAIAKNNVEVDAEKKAAGEKIRGLAGDQKKKTDDVIAALVDNVPAARAAFDKAVADAKKAPAKPPGGPKAPGIIADFSDAVAGAKASAVHGGISGADIRTAEGFKGVAGLLRQSRDDPAKKSADTLARMKETQDRELIYQRRMADALGNIVPFAF